VGLFDVTQAALDSAMAGATQRQQLLAANLANANTPGFKRSDLDFHAQLAQALDAGASPDQIESLSFSPQTDTTTSLTQDGNNVDVDVESADLSTNAVEYQALVAVAQARLKMISSAIGAAQ